MKRKSHPSAVPVFVEPMLAEPVAELPGGPDWILEPKLDGFRGQIHKDGNIIRLLSKEGKDFSERYPEVVAAAAAIDAYQAILDGEIVAINAAGHISMAALQSKKQFLDYDVVFFAFDMMFENSIDLRSASREARRERLVAAVGSATSHHLRLCPELLGDVPSVMEAARQLGLEGIVAKKRDSVYRSGARSFDWRKKRFAVRGTFTIGGYRPSGSDAVDVLVVGFRSGGQLQYAAKVRAGLVPFSSRELRKVLRPLSTPRCPFVNLPTKTKGRWSGGITAESMKRYTWVRPSLVAEIEFLEWTPERRLRLPALVRWRRARRG